MHVDRATSRLLVAAIFFAGITIFAAAALAGDAQKFHGQYEYQTFCATCHGLEGKGDGPMASAMKTAPANLSQLTSQNAGVFPYDRVFAQIRGRELAVVHGREMPLWGERYAAEVHDDAIVRARILELVTYIKSIQE